MASIIAHAIGAMLTWEVGRTLRGDWIPRGHWWYVLPASVGCLPDLDSILPALLSLEGQMVHRGPSHSILAAALIAGCACGIVCLSHTLARLRRAFIVLLACALAHPLLDYLMACGPPVPFLWPLTGKGWLSPVQLVPTAYYAGTPSGLIAVFLHPGTWAGTSLEVLSLAPLWLAARFRGIAAKTAFILASAGGFLLTALLYN